MGRMKFITAAILSLLLSSPCFALQEEKDPVIVHNRILAKVLEKTISVVDVMKKMNVFLDKNYPDEARNPLARYQFYSTHWKDTLSQMIETELMLADATEKQVSVTDAEVREEMQQRFGPHVMSTLDSLGLTYEEARVMVHSEMVVQRMTWFKVNSKALQKVNSEDVKLAYRDFCEQNPPIEKWTYRVLSIRTQNAAFGETIAHKAHELLSKERKNLALLPEDLKGEASADPTTVVSASQEYQVLDKELSASHRQILSSLSKGAYSEPLPQKSRYDDSDVFRIFHLVDHTHTAPPLFQQLSAQIKEKLLERAAMKEQSFYLARLKERFGYDQQYWQSLIPSDFQPFTIQ
jgi:hypothetical protein